MVAVPAGSKPADYGNKILMCDKCPAVNLETNGTMNYRCPPCSYMYCNACAKAERRAQEYDSGASSPEETNRLELAKYLIDKCALNLEVKNKDGWTALIMAAEKKRTGIAKHLIDAGALVTTDKYGKTFADYLDAKEKLQLLTKEAFTAASIRQNRFFVWFMMLAQEVPSDNVNDKLEALLQALKANVESLATADPSLAVALDASERRAMDMASKSMKQILQAALLRHG